MINIRIVSGSKTVVVRENMGDSMLKILSRHGFSIYAPCGGKGTCGKCLAEIRGKGKVVSCTYFPTEDTEVILPGKQEYVILSSQTDFLADLPLNATIPAGLAKHPYGIAADIGTTTVVLYFLDMTGGKIERISTFLNPQKIYGADVITRIEYCQKNEGGLRELQSVLVREINLAIEDFISESGASHNDIVRMVFAGNTTMLHILLGEDPVSIALAPFTPKFTDMQIRSACQAGLKINPAGDVITLPCISAYVGADIVAGLAVLNVSPVNYIYIDIGTNGEMALVKGNEIFTCSTAAGPAFEGARISCGMGAVTGAISSFSGPGKYHVIGNTIPEGICGSGIIDIIAWLLDNGYIDETGLLKEEFVISPDNNIKVIQQDIREIQLAKSSIYSGIVVLMEYAGLTFDNIDALYLAGGFGNYINIDSALRSGLLPFQLKKRIFSIGNSAGIGALQFLKSSESAERVEHVLKSAKYIELSNSDEFTMQFAMNMYFEA